MLTSLIFDTFHVYPGLVVNSEDASFFNKALKEEESFLGVKEITRGVL